MFLPGTEWSFVRWGPPPTATHTSLASPLRLASVLLALNGWLCSQAPRGLPDDGVTKTSAAEVQMGSLGVASDGVSCIDGDVSPSAVPRSDRGSGSSGGE